MSHDRPVDPAKLKRLRRNHNLVFSIVGLSAVFWIGGGFFTLILPQPMKAVAALLSTVGFVILALMIFFSFSFRTPCPRSGKSFDTSEGLKGFFQKINYLTKHCVHCGQSMNARPE